MKKTEKADGIDEFITRNFGVDRGECIEANNCTMCEATDVTFRDSLSVKEYRISGMCQTCQDRVFGA